MAFVNEYVSEEDIRKYDLVTLRLQYNPVWKKEGKLPYNYQFTWTIDRERDIFLISVGG